MPHSTGCRSQGEDTNPHTINVTLGEADGETEVLSVAVAGSGEETAHASEEPTAIDVEAAVVSDAQAGLAEALVTEDRKHQPDLMHYVRSTGHTLWDDDELPLDDRKEIVAQVQRLDIDRVNPGVSNEFSVVRTGSPNSDGKEHLDRRWSSHVLQTAEM